MLYGGFKVQRGHCARCATAGRPLYTVHVEPGKQPRLKEVQPGDPDNAFCEDCWQEIADTVTVRFQVAAG